MIDARERMAFADAYVSLLRNKDNAVGAAEQGLIVYNALFRPTSDGIIKEDGGLDRRFPRRFPSFWPSRACTAT